MQGCQDSHPHSSQFIRIKQLAGISTTCSTLDIPILKRHYVQQYIEKYGCTIRSHVKNWHTCQVNKQYEHKSTKLPAKVVIIKGKDGTEIDFICLTMIDPASSWFEIVEMSVTTDAIILMDTEGCKGTKAHNNNKLPYFDISSVMISTIISNLINKTWFSQYPHCQ